MKLTEKTKRYLAIGGGAAICIGLVAAISLQFGKMPTGEALISPRGFSAHSASNWKLRVWTIFPTAAVTYSLRTIRLEVSTVWH